MGNDILFDPEIFLLADLNSRVNFNEALRGKSAIKMKCDYYQNKRQNYTGNKYG